VSLCEGYWYPLYAYLRRRGYPADQAQDLTQEFFVRVLEGRYLDRADPEKGRFRSFILTSLKFFVADEGDRQRALKRGGGQNFLPLHEEQAKNAESLFQAHSTASSEDRLFDRSWAEALLAAGLERLSADYKGQFKEKLFNELRIFVAGGTDRPPTYAELTDRLGIAESTLRSHVTRLRARFLEALRAEVRRTVHTETEVDEELRELVHVLTGG
jgi:RNA polymerase sigma-70 factor (ECF subfamily)